MRLSAVNGIKKSEGERDWKIDLRRNKMIESRSWRVSARLRRIARDIVTARISNERLGMRTRLTRGTGKVGARHAT